MKKIVDHVISDGQVISEQNEELRYIGAVQKFLNYKAAMGAIQIPKPMDLKYNKKYEKRLKVDGALGERTKKAIMAYQELVRATPDGAWGPETEKMMPPTDKKLLDSIRLNF